jgi:hypothetical protein
MLPTTSLQAVVRQWLKALARKSTQKLTAAPETQQLATLLNRVVVNKPKKLA